ncbi:MAG: coiled-coil domain-containing protein [Bacteroidia bacterium]
MEVQNQNQNNLIKFLVLIIALLTITCGILIWQFIEQNKAIKTEVAEKQEVIEEKDALTQELENLMKDYESLQTNNKELQAEIDQQKEKIAQLMADVEKYKGNTAMMLKYKKETETLRKIMQGYVVTIDSLNQLNIKLNKENTLVKEELNTQKSKYEELNKVKENLSQTVAKASLLTATNIKATGVSIKSSGKESETNRAKKAEKIKVCFDVLENTIRKPGPITIYVRIITPDGKILSEGADESYMFTYDGGIKGVYSAKKTVDYNNQLMTICAYYNTKESDKLPEGKYVVDLYLDETKIGLANFELK